MIAFLRVHNTNVVIVRFGFNYGPTLEYWAIDNLMKDV